MVLARILPQKINNKLFGERERWGKTPIHDDPCWLAWEKQMVEIYEKTQQQGIGKLVNDSGYRIVEQLNFSGKTILEIGPGTLAHLDFWKSTPKSYWLVDRREAFLTEAKKKLSERNIPTTVWLTDTTHDSLPIEEASVDIILSFYSLEHLFPLDAHLKPMLKLLKPGGVLAGAIPCEGGFSWGFGRYLTTRRWFLNNTNINPDKIICWEHPNMADEIIRTLNSTMTKQKLSFWPLRLPLIDINLTAKFIYKNKIV